MTADEASRGMALSASARRRRSDIRLQRPSCCVCMLWMHVYVCLSIGRCCGAAISTNRPAAAVTRSVHLGALSPHFFETITLTHPTGIGVRAVGLEDMEALAEELHSDKTPDDCAAFLSLLHQHAGAAVFRACAALRAKAKPADRNAALARLCERVMDGRFEQEALQVRVCVFV